MPRGGIHKGTLKPTWNAGKTTAVRLPIAKKDEILKLARAIDAIEGEAIVIEKSSFLEAISLLEKALELKANAGGAIKEKIKEALILINPN
ncbi:MAG: hypothetical protein ACK4V4_10395 [Sphingobacteriales bacterium]|jgi:hypothetical protein|uniref:Uncharacterized protein n=2 Tax=Microcystis aeruginosa TaxID=1126 RepID=S3JC77_MICAE|nr:hypothetical protein [Microcystis aeruginosa]NCS00532.1 hypothetical protein [Microcystis aeruginosa L311-01]OCY13367.1 MAG: hypothetical protein BEV12_23995 [Microcystis aeruginosa CACIAM 03]TRU59980.1 MAG: hypothetical protein EWV90_15945 [Microcystis aeruginosa Ma_QC_Ch_20071001_M135]EPF23373.1 hypothetical protein MAESPC_01277 [Microcystis aeruginosa SPC777]CAA82190.1 ORF1 [Microcystis aeruginosa]